MQKNPFHYPFVRGDDSCFKSAMYLFHRAEMPGVNGALLNEDEYERRHKQLCVPVWGFRSEAPYAQASMSSVAATSLFNDLITEVGQHQLAC
jgi:hypothetical protein